MNAMKVAVLGGGNGAHTIAADLTLKGLSVNMFEMEQFASAMQQVFDTGEIEMTGVAGHGKARLNLVTTDLAAAIRDVEVVFIILPGFTIANYARLLAPHLTEDQIIVIMPGTLAALEFRKTLRTAGNLREIIVAERSRNSKPLRHPPGNRTPHCAQKEHRSWCRSDTRE